MKKNTLKLHNAGWKRRVSLVLIFTMLLTTFMQQGWYRPAPSEATGTTNGLAVFNNNTTTPQQSGFTASSNTFATGAATVAGAIPSFMVNKSANTRTENIVGYVTTGGLLYIMRYNGTTWSNEWNVTVGGNGVNGRRFDIAYETSGRAMVVYSTNAAGSAGNEMAYRVWDGATWTAAANINSARLTGAQGVGSIKLASRPGTNEIALMAQDTGTGTANTGTLTAFIWNGTTWGDEPTIALNALMPTTAANPGLIQYDNFGLAYESVAGDLVLVWSQQGASVNSYITHSAASGWAATVTAMPATVNARQQVYIVPNPRTNQIMSIQVRSGTAGIYGSIWDGSSWSAQASLGITMTAAATPNRHWATGEWLTVAGTEYAVAVAQSSTAGTIGYNYFGTAWGTAATLTGVGATNALAWVDSDYDTITPDTLMLTGSYLSTTNILLARRLVITAGPIFTWTTPTGSPLVSALTTTACQNFGYAYSRLDTTPPVTSGVTIDSPIYNTFVGSPFTFHGDLTDNESPVTSCQVCVKNGSECTSIDSWVAGTLSGTGPYTCTAANVTTYSNAGAIASGDIVYVDVRGTSTGGQNVNGGTSAFKTMDKTGPTDGATFTITPGIDQNALSWTAATDAQSGMRTTNPYDVRALPGTTPPADCTSGNSIYTGAGLSYTHSVTPYPGGYSYRVCAYDNVNIPSTGKTGTGLPTKWTATTASCGRCHGYTSVFTDATNTRNNPPGTFVGDHNAHVVKVGAVCSTCHVAPATETSADYKHRSGNIEMQATIKGGSYSKASPFAQTNNPTTGTCSNISCHGANNPTPQWGVGTVGCVDCHNGSIAAPNASIVSGGTVTHRDNVISEFGLAWGHKKSGRGAVTNADCIVCHLEGDYSTQKTSAKHGDGLIDLRDPDGAGETAITNMSSATFTFAQFSTSYVAGSRTSTGNTSNNNDNVLTQKFCLACHDSNGATNPTARTTGGTQYMPFGGVNLGANYTLVNGASTTGGLVDVKSQLTTTNSSWHPVLGPKNRDFPTAVRMNDPYKPTGTRGTSGTLSQGVVLNCFDCHNVSGASPLTTRTVAAHGNAETIRGVAAVGGTPSAANDVTFCKVCHAGYVVSGHGAGSAFSSDPGQATMTTYTTYGCNICHSSGFAQAVPRPIRAQDTHGSNALGTVGTLQTKAGRWATDPRPIAFIRDLQHIDEHAPLRINAAPAWTTGTQCMGNGQSPCGGQGVQNYSVGGTF